MDSCSQNPLHTFIMQRRGSVAVPAGTPRKVGMLLYPMPSPGSKYCRDPECMSVRTIERNRSSIHTSFLGVFLSSHAFLLSKAAKPLLAFLITPFFILFSPALLTFQHTTLFIWLLFIICLLPKEGELFKSSISVPFTVLSPVSKTVPET